MGFGKYKNSNSADLLHRIDLFDLESGDPALIDGQRQFLIVRGAKSQAYQRSVEREQAQAKRKGNKASDFSFAEQQKILARRLASIVVAALIDVGDEEPDVIEFDDISQLSSEDREDALHRLRSTFAEITDLAVLVNDEVVKDINFLKGRGKPLSSLLNSESGTTPSRREARNDD